MVGHSLKHHTAVDVSIVGVRITEESPYKATLTSVFQDGTRRQRSIEGVSQRKYLNNIRPEYSRVYQVSLPQCDQRKIAKCPKRLPKMISLEKFKILAPTQKLPKTVGDLGKLIVAKGFKKLPKVQ